MVAARSGRVPGVVGEFEQLGLGADRVDGSAGHLLRACGKPGVTRRAGPAPLLLDPPERTAGR
ncbi:MAG: hypothetical protein L0I24_10240 [Pseudonocardia sp.]|nr:hypothetical protein [Pseudonocardia sp.]